MHRNPSKTLARKPSSAPPVGLLLNFGEAPLGIKRYVGPTHFRPRSPEAGLATEPAGGDTSLP